ncbi:MAG: LysR family transcriptional regulator [Rhodospirillaceae bacterium]|nr:LysR family transcriptional regulator [Rhodospirillaceae bacterium]
MELRQLRYFREVVRLGSFRRAAERLFITQPALTKSIRALEDELGVQLLERSTHGFSVTPFGEILVGCADTVSVDIARATAEIESLNGKSGGIVRIGGMTTVMQWLLPAAMKIALAERGELRVVTTIALLGDVVTQLIAGDIDIGLCTLYPWHQSDAIVGERLLRDEVSIVGDAAHPLANRTDLTLAELVPFRWVLPGVGDAWSRSLFEFYREQGLPDPVVAVETGSAPLMARVVEGTTMLSLLPNGLLEADPSFDRLRCIDTPAKLPEFEVYVAYRRSGVLMPSTRKFIDALKKSRGGSAR